MNNSPIGVFDSGVGGLTVVREIIRELPEESIVYFGDTARVPYGSKSRETVTKYSRQIVRFLRSREVKAIVIACNTASAYALHEVAHDIDIPVIGVIEPGAKAADKVTQNGRIGIIATEGTVRSGTYEKVLKQINPNLKVFLKACPLFVPLVEEGWRYDSVTYEVADRYLNDIMMYDIDTLVLGCTHYPLIRRIIQKVAGDGVTLVNPAYETAKELAGVLYDNGIMAEQSVPEYRFYVSDSVKKFSSFAESILPCDVGHVERVNMEYNQGD